MASTTLSQVQFPISQRASRSGGQPIGKLMAEALAKPHLISLAAGFVDNATLPIDAIVRCMKQLSENPEVLRKALQYDSTAGNVELRRSISEWAYGPWMDQVPDIDRYVLTAGSNQMLHLAAEAMLDEGDIVLAAAPTYFVFMGTLKSAGAEVIGVSADQDGIDIDALSEQLERLANEGKADLVKAIYIVTDFDNPAGSTLSLERRHALLDLVHAWRAKHGPLMIISDMAYQHLRYEGDDLPPLLALRSDAADYVIECGTLSKSLSPGIRIGWGVAPPDMVRAMLEMKSNIDFGSPHFSQVLIEQAVQLGVLDSHLPTIKEGYRKKRDAMLDALQSELGDCVEVHWRRPKGGLYVWLTLPPAIDATEDGPLWQQAIDQGVLYVPGVYAFPEHGVPPKKNTIRLSFGVQDADGIREGIRRLAVAVRSILP